jgi:hypothetical protein
MKQPITPDDTDAYWLVSLARSNDSETRYNTAEFLMNLKAAVRSEIAQRAGARFL